jgi:2-hydroxychromene-2-carboxylate isomerase
MQMRDEVARMAGMYQRSGMGQQFTEARMKLLDLDNNMTYLQGMQGMQELTLANDPRRLGAVWSKYAGVPVAIQPRSDGRYNIMVNGKVTKEGVTSSDISDSARSAFDQTYRQQKAAASTEYNKETYKAQLDIQKEQAKSLADMIKQIAVERVKGNQAQALEWAKGNFGWDIKPTGSGDGTVIIKPPGASPYLFNPTGRTIEIDGIKVQSNAAYPIAGLPSLGGAQIR